MVATVATGFEADLQALQAFISRYPDADTFAAVLASYQVKNPDFGQGVQNFTDGRVLADEYQARITKFDASATKLVAELRSLLATVTWIHDRYDRARTEDSVSAADVDRQFTAGLGTTGTG